MDYDALTDCNVNRKKSLFRLVGETGKVYLTIYITKTA